MVSLGGALGGTFVALIAPRIFTSNLELPLAIGACALVAGMVMWDGIDHRIGRWVLRIALLFGVGLLLGYLARKERDDAQGFRLMVRNFYGVLHVQDDLASSADEYSQRTLYHGTINHGSQILDEKLRYTATSYYGPSSGVGRAIRALQKRGPMRVCVVGLGAGVLSNFGRAGDFYRIFEINPLVEKISQTEFTFYPHSPADKRILMGDARLTMERMESLHLDLLAVDAFSSDAIPIHLLTREALGVYFRHLKPDGILALHISNRYLDLEPVCARGAEYFGKLAMTVNDDGEEAPYLSSSSWVLLAASNDIFGDDAFKDADIAPAKVDKNFRAWTDDYSNVFQILKLH
jgi:spermidine synthase